MCRTEMASDIKTSVFAVADWIGGVSLLLVLIGTMRIVGTYWVFNHTIDEPAHIACGMEWLSSGTYQREAQHPPLARVMAALGPYLDGARSAGRDGIYSEGLAILYLGNDYDLRLALARAGILPFFWLTCFVVFRWGTRISNRTGGLLAVLVLTNTPTVLAHAGLATTDMALTAGLVATLYQLLVWLEQPSWHNTVVLGGTAAIAALSKFTALPFFFACTGAALFIYLIREKNSFPMLFAKLRALAIPALASLAVCAFLIWAGFRFSYDRIPAPEFLEGLRQVIRHNAEGHPSYLLGSFSSAGFWYYYEVALFFKTPIPVLVLTAMGLVWRIGRGVWIPAAFMAGLLFFAAFSRINIGTRHVLPVFVFMALISSSVLLRMLSGQAGAMRWTGIVLASVLIFSTAASRPDYLSYFNVFAGDRPEKILVDSDLDWGQDMKRLAAKLREVGARQVTFNPFSNAELEKEHGFPPIRRSDPKVPAPGWNAVSQTVLKLYRLGLGTEHPEIVPWPDRVAPTAKISKGVFLYYVPGE